MTVRLNIITIRYSVFLLLITFIFLSCRDEIGDPGAIGRYYINNQSSCDVTCRILNSNRNVFISSGQNVEVAKESCYCSSMKTPASFVVGDLIFYRDSMDVEVEAYKLIPSSNFDTSWIFEFPDNDPSNAEITLIVSDEMIK